MSIIIKFILKNIREKKLRTLLIVISVAAACSLFFASNGVSSSYKDEVVSRYKSAYGSADILISAGQKSPSKFFNNDKTQFFSNRIDYAVGEMDSSGSYEINKDESLDVNIRGLDYDDLMEMNPINLLEQQNLKPFSGDKVIISKSMADKYNFQLGQKIKIKIGETKKVFTIAGISQPTSIFKTEGDSMMAIVPKDAVCELNQAKGKVSVIYIKSKNADDRQQLIQDLGRAYKNYYVGETINDQEIAQNTQGVGSTFYMMLVVVLIMSIFIIYTSFKVIIIERMPIIGTFRSIGATKKTTNIVLMVESVIYGVLGGIVGCAVGLGILYILEVQLSPYKMYYTPEFRFSISGLISAFMFGIVVSFLSTLIPIFQVSKVSVKEIVLNNVDHTEKKRYWKFVLAVLFLAFGIVAPFYTPRQSSMAMLVDMVAIFGLIVGMILILPYINNLFIKLLGSIYSIIFGNEGVLAAKNLKNNKSILNNICLLTIGISALFMINVVSDSMGKEVSKAYAIWKSDIMVNPRADMNKNSSLDERKISIIDGVTECTGVLSTYDTTVEGITGVNNKIMVIESIETRKFLDYYDVDFTAGSTGLPKDFDDDRNIVITEQLKNKFNVELGDTITLSTAGGKKDYKIVAIFNTSMNNGSYAYIPVKYIKSDFKVNNPNMIFVKTNKDNDYVVEKLKNEFKGMKYRVNTISYLEEDNARRLDDMLKQLKAFPLISILIGAFGVINNFIISFMERKRAFAVLASVGMSKRQSIKVLFIEALSTGIIGGIMGVAGGFGMTEVLPHLLATMEMPMKMHFTVELFVSCALLGIAITLVASISPAFKSSKLNIIEAIKYE